MDAGIIENTNSGEEDVTQPTGAEAKLDELCAAALKRRGRRGRPKGTGRKHPDGCCPHGAILHPGRSKAALARKLRENFPARRAVKVSNWKKEHTLFENLDCIADYALVADRHVKRRNGKPIVDNETSTLIAKRIVCLQSMAQRGVQGIRLCLNMKSTRVWKAGVMFDQKTGETIVVPEIEALILRRRTKAKKNRKWNREGRPALWPRRRATEGIRGVRLSATDSYGLDDAWDELECEEEGFEALYLP